MKKRSLKRQQGWSDLQWEWEQILHDLDLGVLSGDANTVEITESRHEEPNPWWREERTLPVPITYLTPEEFAALPAPGPVLTYLPDRIRKDPSAPFTCGKYKRIPGKVYGGFCKPGCRCKRHSRPPLSKQSRENIRRGVIAALVKKKASGA